MKGGKEGEEDDTAELTKLFEDAKKHNDHKKIAELVPVMVRARRKAHAKNSTDGTSTKPCPGESQRNS